ncbi:MAG: radical SAM protein [Lentisphaeria bacterium]|nr:radical SAM protein [Lentisphaeria bacterium]
MIPRYAEPLFRPPAEAESLIFQVAYGCPHNGCRFCGMYKGVPYRLRPESELLEEIAQAGRACPGVRRIFLADGDVMALGFNRLMRILDALNAAFPRLARVGSYANGSSIERFDDSGLEALRSRKLHTLYLGLETGLQPLLDRVGKTEEAARMAEAVRRAQSCGLRASAMVLLGLGGRRFSREHAERTAEVLNAMQPRLLSALRFVPVLGKPFDGFELLTEAETVAELLHMVEGLELERTVFRANHTSNPLPLEARFPADKERLLLDLRSALASGKLDAAGPGILPAEL